MFPRAAQGHIPQAARDTSLPLTAPANAVQQVMMQWHNIMHTGKQQMVCMPATAHQSLLGAIRSGLHVCLSGVHTDPCWQAGWQAHAGCMRCNLFSSCQTWEMLWTAGSWAAEEGLCLMLDCLGIGLIPARPAKCYCWSSPLIPKAEHFPKTGMMPFPVLHVGPKEPEPVPEMMYLRAGHLLVDGSINVLQGQRGRRRLAMVCGRCAGFGCSLPKVRLKAGAPLLLRAALSFVNSTPWAS